MATHRNGEMKTMAPAAPASDTALLIIDMISDWRFPDAERLLPGARAIAPRIAALKQRCRAAGVPVIYANDNRGRWRSDFRRVVRRSLEERGAEITRALMPDDEDYFLLKPSQSAYFCTPLELLLQDLKVQRLLLTGVAADQCIALTAAEARMRQCDVEAPADCIAAQDDERHARMLAHFQQALGVPTPPSDRVALSGAVPHAGGV
jgi:nicotinamidase-related amidase